MSFERKIAAQGLKNTQGVSLPASGERVPGFVQVSAGVVTLPDRGHEDHGQKIRHRLELKSKSTTSTTLTTAEIDPGAGGAFYLRASGDVTLDLKKPPAVPTDQHTPSGACRKRVWDVDLFIYCDSPGTMSWPTNTIFSVWNWSLAGPDGAQYVDMDSTPFTTLAAGYGCLLRLKYLEVSGDWVVELVAWSDAFSDPDGLTDDTTEPEVDPEVEPGDVGSPGTTDPTDTYIDPETGEELVPEDLVSKAGTLVALHESGALSLSIGTGAAWYDFGSAPVGTTQISVLAKQGAIAAQLAAQTFKWSEDCRDWNRVWLIDEELVEFPVSNGGFETGDLEGWTIESTGATPAVLDLTSPPQRPDSTYYLTGAQGTVPGEIGDDFEVSQTISTAEINSNVQLVADVYLAAEGAVAGLEVRAQSAAENEMQNTQWSGDIHTGAGNFVKVESAFAHATAGSLSLRFTEYSRPLNGDTLPSGTNSLKFYPGVAFRGTDKKHRMLAQVLDSDGNPTPVSTSVVISGLSNSKHRMSVEDKIGISVEPLDGTVATTSSSTWPPTGTATEYKCASGPGTYKLNLVEQSEFYIEFAEINSTDDLWPSGSFEISFAPAEYRSEEVSTSDEDSTTEVGAWTTLTCELTVGSDTEFEVRLSGSGIPSAVYFDNVRLEQIVRSSEGARGVGRDLKNRRHVLVAGSSLFEFHDFSVEKIGTSPLDGTGEVLVAAHGDRIVIADPVALKVSASDDGGATFETHDLDAAPVQVFARTGPFALLDTGKIVVIDGGAFEMSTIEPGSRLEYDVRRGNWFSSDSNGLVAHSTTLGAWAADKTMPVGSSTAPHRILATDSGRQIGYVEGVADLFSRDAEAWSLNYSLIAGGILGMQEIK